MVSWNWRTATMRIIIIIWNNRIGTINGSKTIEWRWRRRNSHIVITISAWRIWKLVWNWRRTTWTGTNSRGINLGLTINTITIIIIIIIINIIGMTKYLIDSRWRFSMT